MSNVPKDSPANPPSSQSSKAAETKGVGKHSRTSSRTWMSIIAIVLVFFTFEFFFENYRIPGGSMEPTLLIGDHILVQRFIDLPWGSPEARETHVSRGSVLIHRFPPEPELEFIKRIVGLPGERIRIEEKVVYVNDEPRIGNIYGYTDDWESWQPHFDFSVVPVRLRRRTAPRNS